MVRHGCSLLLALAALAAVSSAPASGPGSGPQPHPPSSSLPLSEQAARLGFTLPPRQPLKATRVALTATGAQSYPFGMADPQPPPRSRQRKPAVASRIRRDADDIYDETRLPTNVVPTSYTVSMQPDLQSGTFYGATDIYIDVVEATSRIILHGGPDIRFREVQIWKAATDGTWADNGKASFVPLSRNEDLERLVIDLENGLEVGQKYLLRFPLFLANLRNDLKGFYLSTYKDNNGRTVRLATTQFEPPAARFAFPCFDEPALKAKFKIIVYHDPALGVRSNMPGTSELATLTVMRTTFEETPIMSTYLLAWVVSDFASLPASTGGVTTWGRKNLLNEDTAYLANMVAPQALQLLAAFNGVPYTMPKTDQFSIPDFDAGAMENWGIVTYREEYLMETEATTIRIREFIGTTVCHELGHAWTGDLVTLDWWSNTWLNEGFATYFENVICDSIFPDWKLMDMYVTDNVHVGIANDVLPGQIAMSSPVHGTGGIEAKFDRISYKKGGSVLRMFEHLIGTEVFKKAMKRYLTDNELKNGTPDKLFSAMDAEAKLANAPLPANTDFATMAKTWTEQAGVPVLTVTRNTGKSTVTITQEQFFYKTPEDQVKTLWYVPIPAIADPSTSTTDLTWKAPFTWLTPNNPSLDVAVTAKDTEWILVNPQQIGYYLVNYDEANWKLLQSALVASPTAFPASTRTQLVHDALAMARAGRLDYAVALPFLQTLKAERSPATWKAGIEALAFLRDRLSLTEAGQALKVFINQITADAYKSVGFGPGAVAPQKDTSKDQERYLRYFVASYACYGGNKQCIDDAVKAIENINLNFDSPNADVKDAALCYAAQNSATVSDSIVNSYLLADGTQDRAQYAAAVSCTQDHTILAKLMDGIMARQDGTDLNAADLEQLINAVLSRWENHRFMLNYYKKNWKKIGLFTKDTFYVSILDSLIDDIRTEEELKEVKAFVAEAFPDVQSGVRQEFELHLAAAEKDLDWSKKYFEKVSQWLYTTTGTGPVAPATEPPTEAPTKPPTEAPTKPPTEAPTKPPTEAPTKPPTGGPTKPPTPSSTPASAADQVTAVATIVIASLLAFMVR